MDFELLNKEILLRKQENNKIWAVFLITDNAGVGIIRNAKQGCASFFP